VSAGFGRTRPHAANNMYVTLRGVVKIRSLGFKQRAVSWDSFGVVGQISRTSFICPPIPATSHTPTLAVMLWDSQFYKTLDTKLANNC